MKGSVRYEKRSAANGKCVAVLTMDYAPVNALSSGVRSGLADKLKEASADSGVHGIVITGAHGSFCAGFDITEFASGAQGPSLPALIDDVEASAKPVVAAIDGVSLGGGLEVALGCHFRVASARSAAGLPEVNLGILPGGGGTQRLPRLVGCEAAIDFMCAGMPQPAARAAQVGIYDVVVPGDGAAVIKAAVDLAGEKAGSDLGDRRLSTKTAKPIAPEAVAAKRKRFGAMRQGEIAPQAIIRCVEAATDRPFREGMKVEGTEFAKLLSGPQAAALQYMFFAERQCGKVLGLAEKPGPLNSVGIIGAGLMGGGVAMCCAEVGMQVVLLDIDEKNLARGMTVIQKNYANSVKRKSKTQEQVDKIMSRITPASQYSALSQCDIFVEAVFENMGLKKKIFAQLDEVCKPGCILASNTSALNIDEIAGATKRPQDVVGCHFFSPANVMKLLENVRGPRSSPRAIATAMEFGKKLKKVTCLVGNCDGFIANRLMGVSGWIDLLQSGLMPHEVDAAAEAYGMRMGPCRMMDLVGLDLFGREREIAGHADPEKMIPDAMFAAGRFGQKTGKGFYKYDEKRRLARDPDAEAMIQSIWKKQGVTPQSRSQQEIVDKLYLPVVNEGFKCLEEGMAMRPGDIDVCLVYGYSWPRWRGGPMQWASDVGLAEVVKRFEAIGGKPCALLRECVDKKWRLNSKEFLARVDQAWAAKWSQSKL